MGTVRNNLAIRLIEGDVLASGITEVNGKVKPYSLVYMPDRIENRGGVPPEAVADLAQLGFHMYAHWRPESSQKGMRACRQIFWRDGQYPVAEKVASFLGLSRTNSDFIFHLEKDY